MSDEKLREELRAAFVAGFMATGEGFNGEYAGSARADPKQAARERFEEWIEGREKPDGIEEGSADE